MRAARTKDSGFTLTELLIVIVVLGVLAGIVVFAVGAFTDNGTSAACKADKKAVEVALEAYRAQKTVYPSAASTSGRMDLLLDPNSDNDKSDGYLRQAPSNAGYTITISNNSGAITSVGC
jgi:general secretion pathway protein G